MKSVVHLILPLIAFAWVANPILADEVIVTGSHQTDGITVGDFDCTGCASGTTNAFSLLAESTEGQVTAGELWKFFRRQGITSVDHLTICLDITPTADATNFGLTDVQLMIEDQNGSVLTSAALGENSLVVPEYEISEFKPEAQLKVALGYDFMKRFSADSNERILLNYSTANSASAPAQFSVQGENSLLAKSFNYSLLFGFITFWVMVFVLLTRVTRPGNAQAKPVVGKNNQQALSA